MDRLLRGCHPAVSFSYFALVIACAMFFMHPLCLALSLLGAGCCAAQLVGGRGLRQRIVCLTYFPSGNPLTLESILYGCASGVLLAAVVLWFVCVTDVITSDKVVYLFGRIIPALSLLLSMTLRFVPQFTRRLRTVAQAQRRLGRDAGRGSVRQRLRETMRVFSIVVTWSLESGLIAADSMRGRGYGLPGRTAFALYRLDRRDAAMLLWLGFCGLYLLGGALAGGLAFQYYPLLSAGAVTPLTVSFFAVYGLLCFTPVLVDAASRRLYLTRKGGDHHA